MSGPGSLGERLRALPSFTPPPGGWSRLQARRHAARRRYAMAGGGLALAASLLVAVAMVVKPDTSSKPRAFGGGFVASTQPAAKREVAQLINTSQNLERQLTSARPQVAVWSSGRQNSVAMIEQRLRVIDAQLNVVTDSDSAESLWRDRVKLMNALVELHEPEAPALQYASYQY
ncbi:MAG TPA: hypothetical protein VM240_02350 [Verrucomicrobiae bacterium]|nr:hypothetical protein [Verrucomicrobiae bacterium]